MPVKKSDRDYRSAFDPGETAPEATDNFSQAYGGASARAISIGRVIDRLCRTPGAYQITIVVPVHRRAPWQVTYARLEPLRKESISGRKG